MPFCEEKRKKERKNYVTERINKCYKLVGSIIEKQGPFMVF